MSEKQILYYVMEIEMPPEYAARFISLADSAHLTVEELIVQYLRYTVEHPEELLKRKAEFDAMPDAEREKYNGIAVKQITPVYSNDSSLSNQTGGAI